MPVYTSMVVTSTRVSFSMLNMENDVFRCRSVGTDSHFERSQTL